MKKIFRSRAFTLIELLVVISIIGLLTAIVTANFALSKSKARDGKRVSDLAQIQLMLELAFDKCDLYAPDISSTGTQVCPGYQLGYFVSKIPTDNGTPYVYATNGALTDYVLRANLENYNGNAFNDDIDGSSVFGQDCDDYASGANHYYCVRPK